ncbi:uncharacterized protein J3D65DRAFT_666019 [Phyllosticta citribraziliensis]|uniref:Uncharacterized protein n=1 Tax=Phyllosticta citribraziliensis TaxID=989973 RepID=A0ABR1LVT1_9PEZI
MADYLRGLESEKKRKLDDTEDKTPRPRWVPPTEVKAAISRTTQASEVGGSTNSDDRSSSGQEVRPEAKAENNAANPFTAGSSAAAPSLFTPISKSESKPKEFASEVNTVANTHEKQSDSAEHPVKKSLLVRLKLPKPKPKSKPEAANAVANPVPTTPKFAPDAKLEEQLNRVTSERKQWGKTRMDLREQQEKLEREQRYASMTFLTKQAEERKLQKKFDAHLKSNAAKEEFEKFVAPTSRILSRVQDDFSVTVRADYGQRWELSVKKLKTE